MNVGSYQGYFHPGADLLFCGQFGLDRRTEFYDFIVNKQNIYCEQQVRVYGASLSRGPGQFRNTPI